MRGQVLRTLRRVSQTPYNWLCMQLDGTADLLDTVWGDFVMLRKSRVVNNMSYDTDLYFCERSIIEQSYDKLAWPCKATSITSFSSVCSGFYGDGIDNPNDYEKYDVYVDKDGEMNKSLCLCDIIKIYHPRAKKDIDAIVHVSSIIGEVKVHFFCRPYDTIEHGSEDYFKWDNEYYSEYAEIKVPSISWLMTNGYYIEDTCYAEADYPGFIIETNDTVYASFHVLSLPYKTVDIVPEEGEDTTSPSYVPQLKKVYVKAMAGTTANVPVAPLQIVIMPYSGLSQATNMYEEDADLSTGITIMMPSNKLSISSQFSLQMTVPSIISKFLMPDSLSGMPFREAYEYLYDVSLEDYEGIETSSDDDDGEWTDEKQCGFELRISSDRNMKNIIYKSYYEISEPKTELDDFMFPLDGIFDNWGQLPDQLIVQVRFIDKWLGNIVTGNKVMITEDMYKYLVNNTKKPRVSITNSQQEIKDYQDMDLSKTNFIDKIQCIIRREVPDSIPSQSRSSTRVLYKPVFYRTQDLSNIFIDAGLKQNIGISLGAYMTKVETFTLKIGEYSTIESARNENFVIFPVNASELSSGTGTYYILTQDGELVSKGQFTVA